MKTRIGGILPQQKLLISEARQDAADTTTGIETASSIAVALALCDLKVANG